MRIFILSCNTGEGHNSAAKAIAEVLTARGIDSEITDGLAFLSPEVSKFISNWHVRIYKRAPLCQRRLPHGRKSRSSAGGCLHGVQSPVSGGEEAVRRPGGWTL